MIETLEGICTRCGQRVTVGVQRGRVITPAAHVDSDRAELFHGDHAPNPHSWGRDRS